VLIVVSNPTNATTVGWDVGFWGAELTHPWYELTERGVEVTIASPDGGKVQMDALSDPRDPSKWSSEDLITMGFVNRPELMARLDNTPRLGDLDLDGLDAVMVAGGLAPMLTFCDNDQVHNTLRRFYESEKPTCIYCHGTAALVDLKLSDGSYLVEGKTVTGFCNAEEDHSDSFVGRPGRAVQGVRGARRTADHGPAAVLGAEGGAGLDRGAGDLREWTPDRLRRER
jgi:putative intracellular protease/amidase